MAFPEVPFNPESPEVCLNELKDDVDKERKENKGLENIVKVSDFIEGVLLLGENGKGLIKKGLDSLGLAENVKREIMEMLQGLSSANLNIVSSDGKVNRGNLIEYVKTLDVDMIKNLKKLAIKVREMKRN